MAHVITRDLFICFVYCYGRRAPWLRHVTARESQRATTTRVFRFAIDPEWLLGEPWTSTRAAQPAPYSHSDLQAPISLAQKSSGFIGSVFVESDITLVTRLYVHSAFHRGTKNLLTSNARRSKKIGSSFTLTVFAMGYVAFLSLFVSFYVLLHIMQSRFSSVTYMT